MKPSYSALLVLLFACSSGSDAVNESEPESPVGAPATQPAVEAQPEPASAALPVVNLLRAVTARLAASSAYRSDTAQVERLSDGDLTTAWNSATGQHTTAYLDASLPPGSEVEGIELTAGFPKTNDSGRDLFTGNFRVRAVTVEIDGRSIGEFPLDIQSREIQRVSFPGTPATTVRVRLSTLEPGTNTSWQEACVSEFRVLGTHPDAEPDSHTPSVQIGGLAPEPVAVPADDEALDGEFEEESVGEGSVSGEGLYLGEAGGLRVVELVLARGVESRQPVDPDTTFSKADDDRVYCYVRLENDDRIESEIVLTWEQVGRESTSPGREMSVRPNPVHVTFAYTGTRRRAGDYACVLRTVDGELLGRAPYTLVD